MIDQYLALILRFNWNAGNIILVLLGILIVELSRIVGRSSSPTTPRTRFNLWVWIRQFNNWISPLLSFLCALAMLAMGATRSTFIAENVNEFAFFAGACGQSLIKVAINGIKGLAGAHGRAPK